MRHPGIVNAYPMLFGLLFVMLVLVAVLVATRGMHAFSSRRRILYAVTDRRVLRLVRHRTGEDVAALELCAVPSVNTRTRSDGSGTVVFGTGAMPQAFSFAALEMPWLGTAGPLAFVSIPDASKVAELIRHLREQDRRPGV